MQWIAENKDKYNIKVVNLSLGISADAENPIDPLVIGAAPSWRAVSLWSLLRATAVLSLAQ